MKRLLILLIFALNQNMLSMERSYSIIDLSNLSKDIKQYEIVGKLLEEAIYKIKNAKTMQDLSNAMKDLKNFALTSKENNKIFKELTDAKLKQLNGKSLKDIFQERKKEFKISEVKELLKKHFWIGNLDWFKDINSKSEEGETALILSALMGNEEAVALLIKLGADINIQDDEGNTALHYAALSGYYNIAKLLIDNNADLNIKNNKNKTPYDIARKYQRKILILRKDIVNLFKGKYNKKK